ncbi:MAG: hypothetical protein QOD92_2914 [Acidimicrobiaceae bacterium]|jgi:hypothetical protein
MSRIHASGYEIGAATTTTDGKHGVVCALVVDPHTRAVTHLAVTPPHQRHGARLVPVAMANVEPTGDVRLAYDDVGLSHLDQLDELDVVNIGSSRLYGAGGWGTPINGVEHVSVWVDCPPDGEAALRVGTPVQVGDDTVGHVAGLVAGFDDHITAVLVASGHLWSHRTVAVPVDAVTGVGSAGVTIAATWGLAPSAS